MFPKNGVYTPSFEYFAGSSENVFILYFYQDLVDCYTVGTSNSLRHWGGAWLKKKKVGKHWSYILNTGLDYIKNWREWKDCFEVRLFTCFCILIVWHITNYKWPLLFDRQFFRLLSIIIWTHAFDRVVRSFDWFRLPPALFFSD